MIRSAVLALLLCLTTAGAERVYVVQPGDTLSALARVSGVSVAGLQQLNALQGDRLRVGQALRLPDGPGAGPAISAPLPIADVYQSGMAVYYTGRPAILGSGARTVMTAAHPSLPFGTWVEVIHVRSGRRVLVMINDRGPFGSPGRVIDLSTAAARALGILGEGVAPVQLRIARQP